MRHGLRHRKRTVSEGTLFETSAERLQGGVCGGVGSKGLLT
jgi:hypothetical protein